METDRIPAPKLRTNVSDAAALTCDAAVEAQRPLERDPLPGTCGGPGDCEVGDDCVCEPVGCFCTRIDAEPSRYRAYRVRSDR